MEHSNSIHIYLIRHGMTAYNAQKKYLGHRDEPILQDQLQGYENLRKHVKKVKFDIIYSSDLLRCRQTAAYMFEGESVYFDRRIREIDFGDWEGKTYEQLKQNPAYCKWLSDWEIECIPNGENWRGFQFRINKFMDDQILLDEYKGKTIAIVSHGGVIRQIVSRLSEHLKFWDITVEFGKAIVMEIKSTGGDFICKSLSEVPIVENANL